MFDFAFVAFPGHHQQYLCVQLIKMLLTSAPRMEQDKKMLSWEKFPSVPEDM